MLFLKMSNTRNANPLQSPYSVTLTAVIFLCVAWRTCRAQKVPAVPPCKDGFYGFQCEQRCSAFCVSVVCHDMTGECLGGCKDGWHGNLCEYSCEEGTFGHNCTAPCSQNCIGGVCDHETGTCIKGCVEGYLGDTCNRVCTQGRWGPGCEKICSPNCATPHCHFQTGYCLKGCKEDFWGADCSLFGNIRDVPDQMRGKFYSQLSAESRSVLLYVLMGEYQRTLEKAQQIVDIGIKQRNELRLLLAGRNLPSKNRKPKKP